MLDGNVKAIAEGAKVREQALKKVRKAAVKDDPCIWCPADKYKCYKDNNLCEHKKLIESLHVILDKCDARCELIKS